MADGLLAGVRVLDLSRLLPGPYASLLLADLGADVTKVEEPSGGDPVRAMQPEAFAALNRHKRSVTLNLKDPRGRELCLRLAAEADVLLESFRPGVLASLGLGYEAVRAVNPRLVYASLTGWGQTGPRRQSAGHDLNYLAVAGVLGITGVRDGAPVIPGVQIADLGGGLLAALAIVSALHPARATGQGAYLDVAMYDLLLSWLTLPAVQMLGGGPVPGRGEFMLAGGVVCYNVYPTADNGWMALGALEPKFWAAFCVAAERPDLLGVGFSPARPGAAGYEAVRSLFLQQTRAAWTELGQRADCCLTPVLALDEALADPQAQARGALWGGAGVAPALGADTAAALAALGLSDAEQQALRTDGVIA